MLGFMFGSACLLGLAKLARGCGYGYGRCGGYGGGCGSGGGYDRGECGGGSCGSGGWGGWGGWRRHGWHHGEHGHGYGHGEGQGDGGWERFALRRLFQHLDTTPGQEKVIAQAVRDAREEGRRAWATVRDSREEVARAVRNPSFDEDALGALFAKHDEALAAARKVFAGSLAKVHEALDERQRGLLADLIERGRPGWGGRHQGPYRT